MRVVEYTGGSTGASLALVCAAKGYRIRIVTSEAFSREKLDQMTALGAELTLVPSDGGRTTKKLILDMIETARELSREPRTYWTDQLPNRDSVAGDYPLGEEIWNQTAREGDAFVIEADLPGVKPEDVKVEAENGDLVVQGWRSLEKSHSDGQFHTMERSSGNFMRRIKLPESIDKSSIEAQFHDGVLRVTLPKAKHQQEKRDHEHQRNHTKRENR